MKADFFRCTDPNVPLYQQLYQSIRASVTQGETAAGEKMPSIRRLAEELSVSRATVEAAYHQLCVEGILTSRPQSGYYAADLRGMPHPTEQAVASDEKKAVEPPIRYAFSTSAVDSGAFRVDLWRRYLRNVLNEPDGLLAYGAPQGEWALREAVAEYASRVRGVRAEPAQIVIGAGIQPLLTIFCGLVRDSTSEIVLEAPGFAQAEQIFADCGLSVTHAEGSAARQLPNAALYLRTDATAPLPMRDALSLLEWAKSGHILVEDDHNGELRYRSRPVPALQGLDPTAPVFYLGTFSKLLMPAVRVGYMVIPPSFLPLYAKRRTHYNQTASKTEQLALAQYIREGKLEGALRKMRKLYRAKCAQMCACLQADFPNVPLTVQETALRVLLHLGGNATDWVQQAAACGIAVQAYGEPSDGILSLGFSGIPESAIADGIRALKNALEQKGTNK